MAADCEPGQRSRIRNPFCFLAVSPGASSAREARPPGKWDAMPVPSPGMHQSGTGSRGSNEARKTKGAADRPGQASVSTTAPEKPGLHQDESTGPQTAARKSGREETSE